MEGVQSDDDSVVPADSSTDDLDLCCTRYSFYGSKSGGRNGSSGLGREKGRKREGEEEGGKGNSEA